MKTKIINRTEANLSRNLSAKNKTTRDLFTWELTFMDRQPNQGFFSCVQIKTWKLDS